MVWNLDASETQMHSFFGALKAISFLFGFASFASFFEQSILLPDLKCSLVRQNSLDSNPCITGLEYKSC